MFVIKDSHRKRITGATPTREQAEQVAARLNAELQTDAYVVEDWHPREPSHT